MRARLSAVGRATASARAVGPVPVFTHLGSADAAPPGVRCIRLSLTHCDTRHHATHMLNTRTLHSRISVTAAPSLAASTSARMKRSDTQKYDTHVDSPMRKDTEFSRAYCVNAQALAKSTRSHAFVHVKKYGLDAHARKVIIESRSDVNHWGARLWKSRRHACFGCEDVRKPWSLLLAALSPW